MKSHPYRILCPKFSKVSGVTLDNETNRDLCKHPISPIAPDLRFSPAFVMQIPPGRIGKTASWGIARRWFNVATQQPVFADPSIIGYGHRSREEAQRECDVLNAATAAHQQGKRFKR